MNNQRGLISCLLRSVAACACLLPTLAQAQSVGACSADKLITYPDATVTIKILSAEPNTHPEASWSAEAGRIIAHDNTWQWNLTGVAPGLYKAVLKSAAAGVQDLCQIKIIVRLPPITVKGASRTTAGSLLLQGKKEVKGYGLYSYLLFANEPDKDSEGRYLEAIEEFLKFPDSAEIEKYIGEYEGITLAEARKRINLAYIPVTAAPDARTLHEWSNGRRARASHWVLAHYDYARAKAIIYRIQRQLQGGPYVVSVLSVQSDAPKVTKYLFQDLSWVPAHLIPSWVNEFLYQASTEEYWKESTTRIFALKLRTIVGVLAEGVPAVQKGLDELVQWVDKSATTGSIPAT